MSISISEFADTLSQILPVVMKGFSRHQVSELYKGKITLPQFLILDFLNKKAEARMTDLARFMEVTTAAMTGLVDRLVRYGYVVRGFEPKDRRIIKIKLTSRGKDLVEKVNRHRKEMIIKVFGKISEKDRQDYLRILKKIRDIIK